MIVYLANKTQFRDDILSNRIEEIVHDSFKGVLGKTVGASELASWKNSRRHMVALVFKKTGSHTPSARSPSEAIPLP
jgi:hypothetical protein